MDTCQPYEIVPFQNSRIGTLDIGAVGGRRHRITALIEVDVTEARQALKRRGGLSFNSWLLKCIGDCVSQYPELHGIRRGEKEIIRFGDVDLSLMIEREVAGRNVPLPFVIRGVNEKSFEAVHQEVLQARCQAVSGDGTIVLGRGESVGTRVYAMLPGFLRRFIWRRLLMKPFSLRKAMGTVMVTSVGMAGRFSGWILPVSVHPLCFAVGAITKKPWVVGGAVAVRDILHLTVLADHDVVDGAPAARALARLVTMLEKGYGLI